MASPSTLKRYSNLSPSSPRSPRTPRTQGDRFIPNRSELDLEWSHFSLSKENSLPQSDTTPSREEYKKQLAQSLFDGKHSPSSRILSFSSPPSSPQKRPKKTLMAETTAMWGTPPKSTPPRKIPTAPMRILDAPEMVDDYYLNLLEWSSSDRLAIALDSSVYLWNPTDSTTVELMKTEQTDNIVTSLSFSKGGETIAVGTDASEVLIFDVERQTLLRTLASHSQRIGALSWNSSMISSGSRDCQIHHHDIRRSSGPIAIWDIHSQEVCGMRWSPDGSLLASGGNDNVLNIWEMRQNVPKFSLRHHQAAVKALAWCPWQSNHLASGGGTADRTIRFWNTSTGACVNSVDTKSQVCALQWLPLHRELVSSHGFSQNQLIVWKFPSMEKQVELKGHTSRVLQLAVSPDGSTVASAAADESLRFWSVANPPAPQRSKPLLLR